MIAVVVLAVLAGAAVGVVLANRFVVQRNGILEARRSLEIELQRRHELVPALVEAVAGYAAHEQAVLERAVAADRARAEEELSRALGAVLAVGEGVPVLQSSERYLELQRALTLTEDRIAVARRLLNQRVTAYNSRVETFPSNLVARLMGLRRYSYSEGP